MTRGFIATLAAATLIGGTAMADMIPARRVEYAAALAEFACPGV